jgi:hypothetical protein
MTRSLTEGVATGFGKRMQMQPTFHGHALQIKNRMCTVCGTLTKSVCACGKAIRWSKGGVTCCSWHMEAVALDTNAEQPLRWPRGKRSHE